MPRALVVKLDRSFPLCATVDPASGKQLQVRAEHAISLVKGDLNMRAALGDWVELDLAHGHDKAIITTIYERSNTLVRRELPRSKKTQYLPQDSRVLAADQQVLAANIDQVCIVQALKKKPISPSWIVRSLVVVAQSGACPMIVLTKADLKKTADDLQRDVEAVRQAVGETVPVIVMTIEPGSCRDEALTQIRKLLVFEGTTDDGVGEPLGAGDRDDVGVGSSDGVGKPLGARRNGVGESYKLTIVLGESGAGKSSMINLLAGREVLETQAVRAKDGAGRHTTVARQMIEIAPKTYIADAPGLRSLPMVGYEAGLNRAYPEIAALTDECQFRDCTHTTEPGCALAQAIEDGRVSEVRARDYLVLSAELAESAQQVKQ